MRTRTFIVKPMIILLLMISLLTGFNPIFAAQSPGKAPTTRDDPNHYNPSANLLEQSFPKLENIKFQPPAANQPCRVSVKVSQTLNNTRAKLTAVKLIYYTGGRFDKPFVLKMTPGLGASYTASIPGLASGTKVNFIIRAEDSNGNVAAQAIPGAINLVHGVPSYDDPPEAAPDSLDLLGISAGYDQKFIYVQVNLQGKISPGNADPPFIHVYGVKVSNPDQEPKEGQFTGKAVLHVPLVKGGSWAAGDEASYWTKLLGGKNKVLKAKKTGSVFVNIKEGLAQNSKLAAPEVEYDCQIDSGAMAVKVSRTAFGPNPSGNLRIIGITWANKSVSAVFPLIKDCTNFLTLYTSSQSYTVK
ncbi:MAG: hypothetical protein K6U80_11420 [Firmicutes bacterium]|nr:hypothetical protein [Bacillota bacterium]